jgi:hypothetical protein
MQSATFLARLTDTVLQGSLAEVVSISNLGVAKTGPVVEESGSLLLEYVNGSACTSSDGRKTTYSTRIHLVCGRGNLVRHYLGWVRENSSRNTLGGQYVLLLFLIGV